MIHVKFSIFYSSFMVYLLSCVIPVSSTTFTSFFLVFFVTNATLWKMSIRKHEREMENERNGVGKLSQETTKGEATEIDVYTRQARM